MIGTGEREKRAQLVMIVLCCMLKSVIRDQIVVEAGVWWDCNFYLKKVKF